jgi:hypothetical protein
MTRNHHLPESTLVERISSFIWYLSWADLQRAVFQEEMNREVDADDSDALREHQWRWFGLMSYWYASLNVVVEAWDALKLHDHILDRLLGASNMRYLLRRYRNAVLHFQCPITTPKYLELLREGEAHVFWTEALHHEFVRSIFDYLSDWTVTSEQSAELRESVEDALHWYPYQHHRAFDVSERALARARQMLSQHPNDGSEARRALESAVEEAARSVACAQRSLEELRDEVLRRAGIK